MCQVINLYGGPGTGKSTTAAGLFAKMKQAGLKVELVREYAKDLVYDGRHNIIQDDQLYIFAKQNRRMRMLHDHVDYIITDSPLFLSVVYGKLYENMSYTFSELILEYYKKYDNINIFITRNLEEHSYQKYGRDQTQVEAIKIDESIKNDLYAYGIPYNKFNYSNNELVDKIFELITLSNMKTFIKENCKQFKPFAHYDEQSDILHVQIEDCSYYEKHDGLFTLFMKNHIQDEKCIGFSITNPEYVLTECGMTNAYYNLVYVLTKISKYYCSEKENCKYLLDSCSREILGNINIKMVYEKLRNI
jgi:nicotinamide riboside kinase